MLGLILVAVVVDQIDGPGALVEISRGDLREVETRCLPPGIAEGDRVRALLRGAGARCPVRGLRALSTRPKVERR